MLSWIREKFGTVVIGGIITFIAFVFVFYGVFSPKSTRGLHEGAVAGTVNGDTISIAEFNREFNRRMEFFKNMGGGKLSDEQLKSFRIKEGVFQELANRKLMIQEAQKQGLVAADEEVREKIREIPAFQKNGKFDVLTYKQVLGANNHSPGSFEKLVREDVSLQQWEGYFQDRVHTSDSELKKEFSLNQDKRNIKYVLLTPESAKKNIQVQDADVKKFLADPAKVNLAKVQYEQSKGTLYKDKKFDDVKETIARNLLAGEKNDEIQKFNSSLGDQIASAMTADKASEARVNALLKSSGVQIKTTGLITRRSPHLPEMGEAKELIQDAFAEKSPIDPKQGGKAKKYLLSGRTVIALVSDVQKPDSTQFEKERASLAQQVSTRKSRELFQEWMNKLSAKAKIDTNPAVVSSME